MTERRRFTRVNFSGDCILQDGITNLTTQWQTNLIDISLKGALITRPAKWDHQNDYGVTLNLQLKGSDVILNIGGVICHQNDDLLGMRFLSLTIESIAHLKRLVQLNIADEELLYLEMSQLINLNELHN
ncbi:MAG: PilZ domain-containing protein [Psychromonas sp.]|nr:PilZ domain-containing protein [Psychromonas sp.]